MQLIKIKMEILRTQDVVKQFENHRALSEVSISVEEATVFGLLGPNGAGKTTLIRIINQPHWQLNYNSDTRLPFRLPSTSPSK